MNSPLISLCILSCLSVGSLEAQLLPGDSLNVDYQLRGDCYAYSSKKNAIPSNGEAHSGNLPSEVDDTFPRKGLYLWIVQDAKLIIDGKYKGHPLYLVNTTGNKVTFSAQDSRLDIIAEAINEKGEWAPITYLPRSWCGNSYHEVILDSEECWLFAIPVFKGTFKTKLRYSLLLKDGKKISSNEITAYINPGQFLTEKKQGHKPVNLMDPYDD